MFSPKQVYSYMGQIWLGKITSNDSTLKMKLLLQLWCHDLLYLHGQRSWPWDGQRIGNHHGQRSWISNTNVFIWNRKQHRKKGKKRIKKYDVDDVKCNSFSLELHLKIRMYFKKLLCTFVYLQCIAREPDYL